ncbi:LURP-one-related family protein [Blastopirellula sp. JC732]|uniref:LURP-one-related family protein n=1 Tax=Blastopirellula sediminis TaxID=2894196 RepID=A0A9X1SLR0_9BACT|nr:LURP-one-related family protein [Blastopirellula sediminis]MCC9605771.1 LURP-one-related family protein [Blastopirellula sediminis]MCC9630929.1 LURP-one-related family protein [Blastopirellula sediminis]
MRYAIREKFWTWGDEFFVFDEHQQPVFQVKGEVWSWGHRLSFQDMRGKELAFINQKLMTWMPQYEIFRDGHLFANLVKELTWFNPEYLLDVPGPNDYQIKGDFWHYNYQFQRHGRVVAMVDKAYWTWTDTYGIDVEDGEDDVAILCSAIVIDKVLDDEERRRN